MVQTRQLRKSREDSHYVAALFRYQREMAIKFREYSAFICLDDKHRLFVGEPGYPVAAVERGKRVIVVCNRDFLVADHDFTRFSLVPSVSFFIDIPEEISESWFQGQVWVNLKKFLDHCCRFRHYQFSIKKCGAEDCDICRPPRLPQEIFETVNVLPDPVPVRMNVTYIPFEKVYGTNTTEVHRPSSSKQSKKQITLPFVASIQHVKNVNVMVQCEECGMWRIVYSKKKLSVQARKELERKLDFSCGASTSDLALAPPPPPPPPPHTHTHTHTHTHSIQGKLYIMRNKELGHKFCSLSQQTTIITTKVVKLML